MQNEHYPPGFSEHDHVPLETSAENWQVGDLHLPSDDGVIVQPAAYDMENDKLYAVQLKDMDYENSTYEGFDVICFDSPNQEETLLDDLSEIPQDVRTGLLEVLAPLLELSSVELAPAAINRLVGEEMTLDRQVEELTAGFDPQMLLNDGLTTAQQQEATQFAAELDSREADAELMNFMIDEAALRLAQAKKEEPDNIQLHKRIRLERDALIDETARVEPDDMPTYGYDTERYSNNELREARNTAEASEEAAIERAKSWRQSIEDERENDQGEDKGRG